MQQSVQPIKKVFVTPRIVELGRVSVLTLKKQSSPGDGGGNPQVTVPQ